MLWLPEPPAGTAVCLGFDGSDTSDWTGFGAETFGGYSFTPRRSASDDRPAIWRPEEEPDGRVPRVEVSASLASMMTRLRVVRMYVDPWRWETDADEWSLEHGDEIVIPWPTNRPRPMHAALERFYVDLTEHRITQDGCPLTALAMDNARKVGVQGDRYILGKPSDHQKIDPAMTRVLAHEAAADARAAGWTTEPDLPPLVFGM